MTAPNKTADFAPAADRWMAEALANAIQVVTLFHTAYRVARRLLAEGRDADIMMMSVARAISDRWLNTTNELPAWLRDEPRKTADAATMTPTTGWWSRRKTGRGRRWP